jgi:hypothetical protein
MSEPSSPSVSDSAITPTLTSGNLTETNNPKPKPNRDRGPKETKETKDQHRYHRLKRKVRRLELWNYILVTELQELNLQLQCLNRLGRPINRQDIENINSSFYSRLDGRYDRVSNRIRADKGKRANPNNKDSEDKNTDNN